MKYQLHALIDLNKNNQYWIFLVKKTQISTSCLDRFYVLAKFSGIISLILQHSFMHFIVARQLRE